MLRTWCTPWRWRTGYVSLEVPPDVAYDATATVALARRLHDQADFPNLLVKIPGTPQDLTAEHLQRHGAGAFTADWAALLKAIKEKTAKLTS